MFNILVVFQSMYEAGRWPVSIYPQWLRWSLTVVVPVAFATTVPAQALAGRLTWQALLGAVTLAVTLRATLNFQAAPSVVYLEVAWAAQKKGV
jgi:ABC-2 type transport system permease protein